MNSRIQLHPDCLRQIFEYIFYSSKYLHITHKILYSCILVNKLYCEHAIPILWRNPWNPNSNKSKNNYNKKLFITKTILSCLLYHHEKDITEYGIVALEKSTRAPSFDYISFCRYIDYQDIEKVTKMLIENKSELNIAINRNYKIGNIFEDIWKLFMIKCRNIEFLRIPHNNINITILPGSQDCLKWLNELECEGFNHLVSSNLIELSKICHNLSKINVKPLDNDDKCLATLIKVQNNLKEINLFTSQPFVEDLRFVNQALSIQSSTLEILSFKGNFYFSFQNPFLSSLYNLKQLYIQFATHDNINHLLTIAILPNLEVLSIQLNYYFFELSLDHYSKLISTTKGHLRRFEIINATRPPSKISGMDSFIKSMIKHCRLINHIRIWYTDDLLTDFKKLLFNSKYLNSIEFDFLEERISDYYDIYDDDERGLQTKVLLDALINLSSNRLDHLYLNNLWWLSIKELSYFLELWKKKNIKLTLKIKANSKTDLDPYLVVIDKFIKDDVLTDVSGRWIKEYPF